MTDPHRESVHRRNTLVAMAVDATLGQMPPDCRRAGVSLRDDAFAPTERETAPLPGMHEDDPAAFAESFTALAHQACPGSTAGVQIRYV